jgi:hypothetical protein
MGAGSFPSAFTETAIVSIIRYGAAQCPLNAMTITETVDISEPDYPGESIPSIAGGRIWKQSPQEDGEVTLEFYPTNLTPITSTTTLTAGGLFELFSSNSGATFNSSQPLSTVITDQFKAGVDKSRDKFMIAILWTDDAAVSTNAFQATATDAKVALRFSAKGCRITSHKAEMTDGILKVTATFKFPAMSKDGTVRSYEWTSTNDGDTAPLVALTYTAEPASGVYQS